MPEWNIRAPRPVLVQPVPIDPDGITGPTPGQARGPYWRRASPGLYVPSHVDANVVEQRILEAAGRLPSGGAVTGWAAQRLWGAGYADGLAQDGRIVLPVPVVVPPGTALRTAPGIEVHRERLDATDVSTAQGIRVTSGVRATFDAARRAGGLREAVVVIDMAVAAGVLTLAALRSYLRGKPGWTGLPQVTRAAELANPRSLSPRETMLRLIWRLDARLPEPKCNWPIADGNGRRIGRPDLLCEELSVIGEFDGSYHRSRTRHRDDLRRDDQFRAVGLEPFRVVGADLHDTKLVVGRIRAAVDRARASTTPPTWLVKADPGPL